MSAPGILSELRLAVWLKRRDLLGRTGTTLRSRLLIGAVLLTGGFLSVLVVSGATTQGSAARALFLTASVVWPLWAIVPLLSGGAGEATSARSLAPYPVSPRAHLLVSWVSAFLDFPYLLALPPLLALSVAAAGPLGPVLVLLFALGASAVGQAGAWLLARAVLPRRHPVLLLAAASVTAVAVLAVLDSVAALEGVSRILPAGHLAAAATASAGGEVAALGWALLLVLPAALYVAAGPRLVAAALDAEGRSEGPPARRPARILSTPMAFALPGSTLLSTVRALSTQAALVGVVLIPVVVQGSELDASALGTIATIAAISASATLAVNTFAFDGSGVLLLLSAPVRLRSLVLSRLVTLALLLLVCQLLAILVASALEPPPFEDLLLAAASCVPRALLLAALGVRWSIRHPVAVDFDSLRNRVTSPRSAATFLVSAAVLLSVMGAAGAAAGPLLEPLVLLVVCLPLATLYMWRAERDLSREGSARLVSSLASY